MAHSDTSGPGIEELDSIARDIVAPATLEDFENGSSAECAFQVRFECLTESDLSAEGTVTVPAAAITDIVEAVLVDDESFDEIISLLGNADSVDGLLAPEDPDDETSLPEVFEIIREMMPMECDAFYRQIEPEITLVVLALLMRHLDDDE